MNEAATLRTALTSVVVPTWNRATLLTDCLQSLVEQEYPPDRFEVIVIDDGSTDATAHVVRQFAGRGVVEVRYVRLGHVGLNAARNAGLEAARGDPVCFVDDDVDAPPGWLAAMIDGARRQSASGCLGGPVKLRLEAPPPRTCEMESWERESQFDLGPDERLVAHVNGCNMAIRRWAVDTVGPFDASLSGNGDESEWELRFRRAGGSIAYLPAAWLWHRRTAADLRLPTLVRRRFRQGVAYTRYAALTGERISIVQVLSPVPFYIVHAARRRCVGALLEVARKLGLVWGELSRRGQRSP